MSKKETEKEEVIVDVTQTYTRVEHYVEENKNSLSIIVAAIVVVVGGYFGYKYMILEPQEKEASEKMWKAEQYFEVDSFNLAINGDGNYFGFQYIADEYSGTKAGNLANYYLGVSYLKKGEYQKAIDYLEEFDAEDKMLGPIATGAIGDAHMELGNTVEAMSNYDKAARQSENKFTTPYFLFKAAFVAEQTSDFTKALDYYKKIEAEYPESNEGRNIEKYLARASAMVK